MVRTIKRHQEEDEIDDEEFTSTTPYVSSQKVKLDGKKNSQKASALRSKHSETEQRRRSKINERFQILRDIIPENDQKRDKASFLLEVIQYIQFLQEKIQMYEGTYQGWNLESSKMMPWSSNSEPIENFVDQPQFVKNGSSHEDNIVMTTSLLGNSQNSIESDLSGAALHQPTDHPQVAVNQEIPPNIPVQPNLLELVPAHPPQGSLFETNHLATDSQPQFWLDKPHSSECAIRVYYPNHQEQLRTEDAVSSVSSVYSQGLLNTLTYALQSSGVDLSQSSISVQLDVGKRTNGRSTTSLLTKEPSSIQQLSSCSSTSQNYDHTSKKLNNKS